MSVIAAAWFTVMVGSLLLGASLGAEYFGGATGALLGALVGISLGALVIVLAGVILTLVFKGVVGRK
jgi:hypothetical protein